MIKELQLVFAALVLIFASQNRCRADVIISFNETGATTAFTVLQGESISVPVFMTADVGEVRLSTQGLYSAGTTVRYFYGSGTGDADSGNASISSVALDPKWTDLGSNYTEIDNSQGNQYAILEGVVDGPPIVPVVPTIGTNYIKIGTVTFQSGVDGNVTELSLSTDLNVAFINLLYNPTTGDPLDGHINFAGATLATITAVPEPSSLICLGLAFSSFLGVRFRRNSGNHEHLAETSR